MADLSDIQSRSCRADGIDRVAEQIPIVLQLLKVMLAARIDAAKNTSPSKKSISGRMDVHSEQSRCSVMPKFTTVHMTRTNCTSVLGGLHPVVCRPDAV